MSSTFTHLAWIKSQSSGTQKLVLLALADHADRNGEVSLSMRDLAALCSVSKARVETLLQSLIDSGELRKLSTATGCKTPSKYRITLRAMSEKRPVDKARSKAVDKAPDDTPKPRPLDTLPLTGADTLIQRREATETTSATPSAPPPAPALSAAREGVSQADVTAALKAARITAPSDQPLYWFRREHRADLERLLADTGLTVPALCARLCDAITDGRRLERPAKRILDLKGLINDRGGAR